MNNLKALEIFAAQTLCDVGIALSLVSFLLHVGRPYFERILGRLTLRVGADLWWLGYLVVRDGTLFLAVVLGVWHLNLDLMADIKVALPFVPLGTVALAGALAIKVLFDSENAHRSRRASTAMVSLGAVSNVIGYVFVMEGPGQEYAAASSRFWLSLSGWRSNANPQFSTVTFYLAWALLGLLALAFVAHALRPRRTPHSRATSSADRDENHVAA